jgi:hypothetical protein
VRHLRRSVVIQAIYINPQKRAASLRHWTRSMIHSGFLAVAAFIQAWSDQDDTIRIVTASSYGCRALGVLVIRSVEL